MSMFFNQISSDFPEKADLVIVGGGIVGVSTAFYASRAGFATVLLEKMSDLGSLTTGQAAECLRAQWKQPFNIHMMRESIEIYKRFSQEIGIADSNIDFQQRGYLYLTDSPQGFCKLYESTNEMIKYGLTDVEFLTGTEVRRRFPYVSENVIGGRFRQEDGWLSVQSVIKGFIDAGTALIRTGAEVTAIDTDDCCVTAVTVNGSQKIRTKRIVIAAGPFAQKVGEMAGASFPSNMLWVTLNRELVTIKGALNIPPDAPMTIDYDTGAYWRPVPRGKNTAGALAGWNPEPKISDWNRSEIRQDDSYASPTWKFRVNNEHDKIAQVRDEISRLSPFWNDAKIWVKSNLAVNGGQYAYCFWDSNPLICEHPIIKGLFFNTGFAGHGIMNAPAAAKFLVRIIKDPHRYHGAMNPFRFERFSDGSKPAIEHSAL